MHRIAKNFFPSVLLALFTFAASGFADDVRSKQVIENAIKPVVRDVENAIQGKPHRPIEEFVAKDATFQGLKPLHEMLKVSREKAKPFPNKSTLRWLELSALTPRADFKDLIPAGIDPESTVLVFRDTETDGDRSFRVLYWLSKRDGRWLVVYLADGWMPSEPLASISSRLAITTAPVNSADAVKAQDPRVWAGVSASVPDATTNAMFSVGEINRLMIGVALVNDGDTPIPFDRERTRLIINGEAIEIFDANGPVWNEVKRGRPFGASAGGLARYFSQPGLYKIQWTGDGFSSTVLEIRITAN